MRTILVMVVLCLVACGAPLPMQDAALEAASSDVMSVDAGPVCSPQCPSGQTCVNGACFAPVLQRLALSLMDPQQLLVGQMLPFRVSAVYSSGEMRDVSIETMVELSSQTAVRIGPIVNNQPSLVGLSVGEAVLTARYQNTQAMVRIVVPSDPRLASVAVNPSSVTVNAGGQSQVQLVGTYMDGSSMPVSGTVMWTSSNQNILEVVGTTASATLRASASGTARVTGAIGGLSAVCVVTIR